MLFYPYYNIRITILKHAKLNKHYELKLLTSNKQFLMTPLFFVLLFTTIFNYQNTTDRTNTVAENCMERLSESHAKENTTPPLLLTYINELPFYDGEFPLKKVQEGYQWISTNKASSDEKEEEDFFDGYKVNHINDQQIQCTGGWFGTAGSQEWKATYQLLNEDKTAPIVLLAVQNKESIGGYFADIEFNYDDLKAMIAEGNTSIDENRLIELAEQITDMDYMDVKSSLDGGCHKHDLRFWVWQKQKGQWKNITDEVFQPAMYTQLMTSFPFLTQAEVRNATFSSFSLAEKMYVEDNLVQNKAHWKHWLGVEDLAQVSFDLKIRSKAIQFEISKNKNIQWNWDGEIFNLDQLPNPVLWENESCSNIDYSSNKKHTFVGTIADIPIKMEVYLNNGKISGKYWYIKNPKSKFPIEGNLETSSENTLSFYRIKNEKQREHFWAYFVDCEFRGWWQHQETMKTEEFSLKLVQE